MKKIFSIVLLICMTFTLTSCHRKKFERMLDNREYDKAYTYLEKHSGLSWGSDGYTKASIATLQIADLIQNGDYALAKQISIDFLDDGIFVHTIINNLTMIYQNRGAKAVLTAISWMPTPPRNNDMCSWKKPPTKEDHDRWRESVEEYARLFNSTIDVILNMMVMADEKDYLEKMVNTLIPTTYPKKEANKNKGIFGSDQVRSKDKNGNDIWICDYSEVNRIREKYGFSPLK